MKTLILKQKVTPEKWVERKRELCEKKSTFTVREKYEYETGGNYKIAPPKKIFLVELTTNICAN